MYGNIIEKKLFLGYLRGFLGDFDGDLSNDLRILLDGILLLIFFLEEIYRNFGLLCNVDVNINMLFLICIILLLK